VAHAARDGAHQDFAILWLVDFDIFYNQRLFRTIKYGGLHRRNPPENLVTRPEIRGIAPRAATALAIRLSMLLDAAAAGRCRARFRW
jgi:hypothetical protein